MKNVRAFPWAALDATTREEIETARQLARFAGNPDVLAAAARALESVIGTPVEVRQSRVFRAAPSPENGALAVLLDVDGASVVVEVESSLAVDVVSRALKRPGPPAIDPDNGFALSATSGALGAILVRALRQGRGEADVRVLAAGRAHSVFGEVGIADPAAVVFTVMVDADAYRARVVFSQRAATGERGNVDGRALGRLGDLVLSVPLVAAVSWSPASELSRLVRGDVWIPERFFGRSDRASARGSVGVVLAAAHASRGVSATLEEDGRLVLGKGVEDLTMSDAENDTLLESALEAPVVVRVELGAVELRAREWAALRVGDVITTGSRVGAHVVLRAGGAELGRGELVEVDGDVGVRITSIGGTR